MQTPNIVYVFSDTHRWSSMDFTGTPACHTPVMRAMKENGVSFDQCYSTLPTCSPHRAILMTGRWPWEQGFIANHMALKDRPDNKARGTLGHLFRDAGYSTHYVGKWHLGDTRLAHTYGFDTATIWSNENHASMRYLALGAENPFGDGEHDWFDDERYTGVPVSAVPGQGEWVESGVAAGDTFRASGKTAESGGASRSNRAANRDRSRPYKITGETDHAVELIRRHADSGEEKPLFLMLSLQDPHSPWRNDGGPTYAPYLETLYPDGSEAPFPANDALRDPLFHRDYNRSIMAVDRELGRIRTAIAEAGLTDNTILVYSSDHGGMGGQQGVPGGQKRWPHDNSTRVPFLVEWPKGIPEDKRNRGTDALFASIDIFPTLCSLAGLEERLKARSNPSDNEFPAESLRYLRNCPGVDHAENVTGAPGGPDPESVYICHESIMNNKSPSCPIQRTVITKNWLYSVKGETRIGNREQWLGWDEQKNCEWLLYDRKADPLQMNNLVNQAGKDAAGRDALKRELREKLADWEAKAVRPFVDRWFEVHPHAGHWEKEHDGEGREVLDRFPGWGQ